MLDAGSITDMTRTHHKQGAEMREKFCSSVTFSQQHAVKPMLSKLLLQNK
jgi:hypothetical protein